MQTFTALRGVMGVYVIAHRATGQGYVGSSANLASRLYAHRRKLRRGEHPNARLQSAWSEHGEAAFVFLVLQRVTEIAELRPAEQRWLDGGTCEPGVGFNRSPTTHGVGWRYTDEQRARLADAHRGRPKSPEHRAAMSAAQRAAVTPESRARCAAVGAATRGVPKSAEHRAKIGAAQSGGANHQSKLTEPVVIALKRRLADGESVAGLARETGASYWMVYAIKTGLRWGHVVP